MTRLQTEPVDVRRRENEPDQFLWKGRLYVVHEVLSRWTEAGGWWRAAALRALTAGDHAPAGRPAEPSAAAHRGTASTGLALDDGQSDWWRVEAGCGRFSGTGVYDLGRSTASGTWSLSRVQD